MKPAPTIASFLDGLAKTFFAFASFAFIFGGGLIHAETQMNRFNAEMIGLAITAGCVILGLAAKSLAENSNRKEESTDSSPTQSL